MDGWIYGAQKMNLDFSSVSPPAGHNFNLSSTLWLFQNKVPSDSAVLWVQCQLMLACSDDEHGKCYACYTSHQRVIASKHCCAQIQSQRPANYTLSALSTDHTHTHTQTCYSHSDLPISFRLIYSFVRVETINNSNIANTREYWFF